MTTTTIPQSTIPQSAISQSPAPSISKSPRRHPRLTPVTLLDHLQQNPSASLNSLTAHFHCSLDKLSKLLNNPEFLQRHKLQTQLAFLQSRLAANASLPEALAKTITLMHESEKPEVSRRAAAALIQIAGLPIRTATQPAPAPLPEPPPPPPPPLPKPEEMSYERAMAILGIGDFLVELKRREGIDLEALDTKHCNAFVDHLRKFFNDHNLPLTQGEC